MKVAVTALKILALDDLETAVSIQSRAFQNDPLWQYLYPELDKRNRYLPLFYRAFLRAAIQQQQAVGVAEPLAGIAVWSRPQQSFDFSQFLNRSSLRLFFSPFALAFIRAGKIFGRFETMQKQYAPTPHYYLNTISVLPEAQGQGLASQLIRPFLPLADDQSVGVYTETMTPANVALYEHFGFHCMEEYQVPGTTLRQWAFYRPVQ